MQLTTKENNYAIVDDVFDKNTFDQFVSYFGSMDFAFRSMTGWQKIWRLTDGQILAGPPYYHSRAPFGCPMDGLHAVILALAEQHLQDVVGKKGEDWDDFFLTPYIYPVGTKISWHNDTGYVAAAIFYPHEKWSSNWGGELLLADVNNNDVKCTENNDPINRQHSGAVLDNLAMGRYISPKPNRMVFTKTGVWHSINRVDVNAGEKARCSVVAFFTKS